MPHRVVTAPPHVAGRGVYQAPALPRSRPGQPLPPDVQAQMATVFGTDFTDVRIHIDTTASSIGALAFTHNNQIYFAPGQYNLATPNGLKLLAHELAHVLQQRQGKVCNPYGEGVAIVQDPTLEAEAARLAQRVAVVRQTRPPQRIPAATASRTRAGTRVPPVRYSGMMR
ncbi:MAG: DUF4157 domain-containing protein [Candidatus Tectomicrobia bacterium]|nr:DUF4157 domain-containing protein [Candidatus Tectomicrobia bacterium]